ncbi:SLBB domain-containing protein [Vibrio hibernica]|uniref:SLBB domain-containing protein n=1 Tax=Vibrio hibernica TaxID=2587465 RepID=UPI0018828D8F|nr:SLBB domain-containing protein [Vibrio hibernica]
MSFKQLLIAIITSSFTASVFAFNPTPAQIKQFQSLPKAQQEQLAKRYGVNPKTLTGGGGSGQAVEPPAPMLERTTPAQVTPVPDFDSLIKQIKEDDGLQPFGYDMFLGQPMEMSMVDNMPVPLDYKVAPGDTIKVQMFGRNNDEATVTIGRDGSVNLPELGPISVTGQTFEQLQTTLTSVINKRVMGVKVAISMVSMRAMQVYIVGEAIQPGAYNVNGLTTITQALIASGGVKESGSLRNIQLKRKGKVVKTLDLYGLLIKGDSSKDIRLMSGDTLFIPTKKNVVTLNGEVIRPAIYELKGKTTLGQLLAIGGGAKPEAYLSKVSVRRTSAKGLEQATLDLSTTAGQNFVLRDGDEIKFGKSSRSLNNAVAVRGEVVRQGAINFTPGMKVSDVIGSIDDDLNQSADMTYALLVREVNYQRDIEVYQFNLLTAISEPNSKDNLLLQEKDQIFVFDNGLHLGYWYGSYVNKKATNDSLKRNNQSPGQQGQFNPNTNQWEYTDVQTGALIEQKENTKLDVEGTDSSTDAAKLRQSSREELLQPIVERLKEQSTLDKPAQLIEITGSVKFPGVYPLPKNKSIHSVVAAAGGLTEDAYLTSAEVTRRLKTDESFSVKHFDFSLSEALAGNSNTELKAQDHLIIKKQPDWQKDMVIDLQGEVKFPGLYTFQRGDTIKDMIVRAGGFTQYAYIEGAVFSRERLKRQEKVRMKQLQIQLKQEISSLALRRQTTSATYQTSPSEAISVVDQLEKAEAVGRLVIDMQSVMKGDKDSNLILEKGDKLFIPALNPVVSVVGEVQYTSNHIFKSGVSVEDYIDSAGGTKRQADSDRIYIVKANGSVELPNTSFWFSRSFAPLEPGDTIIVPIDTDYLDGLSTMTSATQILYQIGVAWSAVK